MPNRIDWIAQCVLVVGVVDVAMGVVEAFVLVRM